MDNRDRTSNLAARQAILSEGTETHKVVSVFAYLAGLESERMKKSPARGEAENVALLQRDRYARIVHNLCTIRTEIFKNYKRVSFQYAQYNTSVLHVSDSSAAAAHELKEDGCALPDAASPIATVIEINKALEQNIDSCRQFFPDWVHWSYLRNLFVSECCFSAARVYMEVQKYHKFYKYYPYQMYIVWNPEDHGNLLFNDRKFLTILYKANGDEFTASKTAESDANSTSDNTKCMEATNGSLVLLVEYEKVDVDSLRVAINLLRNDKTSKIARVTVITGTSQEYFA